MDQSVLKPPAAWQPLTPAGVAAFARASVGRLLIAQVLMAILAGALVVWFLHEAWFPVIHQAIGKLPAKGEIRAGTLQWQGGPPILLAENRFLSLAVDPDREGLARSSAQLRVEFGRSDVRLYALLGFLQTQYPKTWRIAFNQQDLDPWWGAWSPALLAIAAVGTAVGLIAAWWLLAMLYTLPIWLAAFFCNRELSLSGSWRLGSAALLPGALLLSAAVVLYGLGMLDLVRLLVAAAVHVLVGWLYVIFGVLALARPLESQLAKSNPFKVPKSPPG